MANWIQCKEVEIGNHTLWFEEYDDNSFLASYEMYGEERCSGYYPCTVEGIYNAIWEALCSFDRLCTNGTRRLGSCVLAGYPH